MVGKTDPGFLVNVFGLIFFLKPDFFDRIMKTFSLLKPRDGDDMKSREEVLEILATVKPELRREFKVRRIGLFGSYARSQQSPDSDVDVLVEVDPSIGLRFVTLAERIEKHVGLRTEVVSSRAIKPRHRKLIESEVIYV